MSLRIDRYEVQRLIGQGAMGKVYLARDPKIGRQVAIKVMLECDADDAVRQRFRLEARAIAALKHPNIVELYDYSGENAPDLFLVMEYIEGRSLAALLRQHGAMSEPSALCVAHELCLALGHSHQHNIVHRDLKPENVLLSQGRVVLTDFGIVKAIAKSAALDISGVRTRTQVVGTPGFMAPEQFAGRNIDARTDIFALGSVLYCLTTDKMPFDGNTVDEVYRRLKSGIFRDPRDHNALLSPGFCNLVRQCLAARPKDRLGSAEEMRVEILGLLGSHGVSEVRHELVLYEQNPATYAIEQRRRSVEVLLRDLKMALNDRDEDMAESIARWLKVLAPLDKRLSQVTVEPETAKLLGRRPRRFRYLVAGLLLGAAVGLAAAVVFNLRARLPHPWLAHVDRLVHLALP
jgi:eukaryotic-like serine/threonine-protein kinase